MPSCTSAYTLSIKKKYTSAYTADHTMSQHIWRRKSPRACPMNRIAIAATQLQSDGKVMAQIKNVSTILIQPFSRASLWMTSSTRPHASDHTTPVWLNGPVDSGKNGMPKQKSYAKCEMNASANRRTAYFFTSCV